MSSTQQVRPADELIGNDKKRQRMAHATAEALNKTYVRPSDWPAAEGDIDLMTADLPHASANTEWWYVNSHAKDAEGNEFSVFASFFRVFKGKDKDGNPQHLHALSGGVLDVAKKAYYPVTYVDAETPKVLKYQLENGMYDLDSRLARAMLEIANKGHVPLPDVPMEKACVVSTTELNLDYGNGNYFRKNADNTTYSMGVNFPTTKVSFEVVLTPQKKPTRQGHGGVVQVGVKQETMFYYFIPRNQMVGSITLGDRKIPITGAAWYDHEFGGGIRDNVYTKQHNEELKASDADGAAAATATTGAAGAAATDSDAPAAAPKLEVEEESKAEKDASYAWNWFSMQLEDGRDITATNLVDWRTGEIYDNFAIVIGADSSRVEYPDLELEGTNFWTSVRSSAKYPLSWKLTVPSGKIDLQLEAIMPQQEIMTLIAKPSFWEGRMRVTGSIDGVPVTGNAFLERHGFGDTGSLDEFFKIISNVVRDEVRNVMPLNPTYEQARDLLADKQNDHYMDGADLKVFNDTMILPMREIIDRGGKAWRSYACLLCIDCVGGNSLKFQHWLAMPELMHVGSLIVDDIQDKSVTRRGGPTCHLKHGEPIAINVGTSAYFLAMDVLQSRTPDLTPEMRLRLYELYFLTLRAGHSGQAFDIYGQDYRMDAICSGEQDPQELLRAVTCTHRLKSAVPAGNLARMGALIGGATPTQIEVIGRYMESIGIAFQIIDDVLNLKGFEGDVKTKGEDLREGKVTYPVAFGMTKLSAADRTEFWSVLKTKPQDPAVVGKLIQKLQSVDAIEGSAAVARDMVEDAWKLLDAAIPDSYYKVMIRSFGWYVLERHY